MAKQTALFIAVIFADRVQYRVYFREKTVYIQYHPDVSISPLKARLCVMTVENWKKNSKNDVFDTAESIFANPLFGIWTIFDKNRANPHFPTNPQKRKGWKEWKSRRSISWDPFLDANICSNGGLIILKLMLKLLMRRSPMHHYSMRSLNYTFWTGKLIFNHH